MTITKKANRKVKSAALFIGGAGMFFVGGGCIPDNFWIDAWARMLNITIDAAANAYVIGPVTGTL